MSLIEIKAVLDVDQDCKSQKATGGQQKGGTSILPLAFCLLLSAYCPLVRIQVHAEAVEDQ